MSRKIPLEPTIGGAYAFLFSDFISILGIVWFPALLFGGLCAAAIWYGAIAHPLPPLRFDAGRPDLPFVLALARIAAPVSACIFLLGIMLTTGLTQRALGRLDGRTYFYFNLGVSFWRMFAAALLAGLMLALLDICLRLISFLWIHFAAPLLPPGVAIILGVLGALALAFVLVYAVVRLIFLLPSVVVAEERIGLGRAWALGAGNFWRAFLVLLVVLVPAIIVFGLLNAVLFSGLLREFPMPPFAGEDHPAVREVISYVNKVVPLVLSFLKANWPLLVVIQLVYWIVTRALFAGASANAYLSVAAEDEAQPG
jgi:hypothetical protein